MTVSSTGEHLPTPEPSNSHQHLWQSTQLPALLVKGFRISVYKCACGTYLRRNRNAPRT